MKDGLSIFQRLNRVCGMHFIWMREDVLVLLVCGMIITSWFGSARLTVVNFSLGISAPRDLELYRSLENAMYADHRLRMRVDTQVNILEGVIAKMKAAESSHGHDNKFEMENREE